MKKFYIILFTVLFLSNCKENEQIIPNEPPSNFKIYAEMDASGKRLFLDWEQSVDPEGDEVTYSVFYKDTLIKNIKETNFVMTNLPFDITIEGNVIAKDSKGKQAVSSFKVQTGTEYVSIPDLNFEKSLIDLRVDDIKDGRVLREKLENITYLDLDGSNKKDDEKIENLSGIEAFTDLKLLICDSNKLQKIDLSKNKNLVYLNCHNNQLSELNVNQNIKLENLGCFNNKLVKLETGNLSKLRTLNCLNNKFTSLDVTKNVELTFLHCYDNELTKIDVSKNLKLEYFDCSNNNLTTLDISKNISLINLNCSFYNKITQLDISNNINLRYFNCSYLVNLKSIDVSKNTKLIYFYCGGNELSDLDVSKNILLESMGCAYNKIKVICVANLNQVSDLWSKDETAVYKVCP